MIGLPEQLNLLALDLALRDQPVGQLLLPALIVPTAPAVLTSTHAPPSDRIQ